jgi:outer membrane protein
MIKYILFLLPLVLLSQPKSNIWTLQDCITFAFKNNISIKNIELDLELSKINKKDALAAFLPTINASSSHSWNIGLNQNITTGLLENQTTQFTSLGANIGFDIYNGLQNQNRHRKAILQSIGANLQIIKIHEDISLNIANAFLQILFNKENLKVVQNQLENDKMQIKRTKSLYEVGQIPKGDLYDIEATIANGEQRVIAALNTLFLSKMSLAQILQLSNFADFDISNEEVIPINSEILLLSADDIIKKSKENRIELKISQNNIDIAKKDIDIAIGAYKPRLQGFYGFNTRASYSPRIIGFELDSQIPFTTTGLFVQGTNQQVLQPNLNRIIGNPLSVLEQFDQYKGSNFGIQLSIPIFNGFATRNNVQRAKINYDKIKLQDLLQIQNLERNIYTTYNDLKSAKKLYEASLVNLKSREESFHYAKERYNIGLLNSFEYNQQQTLLVNSQSEVLKNKYDYIFKTKILEFYYGIQLYK